MRGLYHQESLSLFKKKIPTQKAKILVVSVLHARKLKSDGETLALHPLVLQVISTFAMASTGRALSAHQMHLIHQTLQLIIHVADCGF